MQYKITEFQGIYNPNISVTLVRRFRVLHNLPKCWEEVCCCCTPHGTYESGLTTIYQSKTTKKFYMVRYFDGCFSQMYAEVSGVDWREIKREMDVFWRTKDVAMRSMWDACHNGEMTYREKNIRVERMRNEAKDLLMRLAA